MIGERGVVMQRGAVSAREAADATPAVESGHGVGIGTGRLARLLVGHAGEGARQPRRG